MNVNLKKTMDKIINELMEAARKKLDGFSYMDQQLAYDTLADWCRTQADTALKMEYMADEMDCESMNE